MLSLDNFLTYTNNDMKFSIQYPSNCQADYEKYKEANVSVVYFSDCFEVSTEKVEPYLDTDTMTVKNTSLQQRVQQELDDSYLSSDEVKIIRKNWVTVGGNAGYKIEYVWSCEHCTLNDPLFGRPDHYSSVIFTMANGKLYRLSYSDEPLKVPETLPLANKMVESFQFNTEDEINTRDDDTYLSEDKGNNSTFEDYQNKYCPPLSLVLCTPPHELE